MATEQNDDGQGTSSEEKPDATTLSRDELKTIANGGSLEAESEADDATGKEGEEGNEEGADGSEDGGSSDDGGQDGAGEENTEVSELKALVAELEERTGQQSKLLDKFGTEVGLLRKKTPEDAKARLEEIRDLYLEDPVEGHKAMQEYFKEEEAVVSKNREEEISQIIADNRSTVTESASDFEENLEANVSDIAEILEADGASSETIEAFKKNPYVIEGSTLFALHKRNAVLNELVDVTEQLEKSNARIAELEKKPGEVLRKVADAASKKTLTGKDGGRSSAGNEQGGDKKVTNLSRAELKKIANGG